MALMMVCLEGLKGNKHLFCFCPLPLCRLRKKHLWPLLLSCIQFKTVFIMVSTTFCFAFQFPPFSVPSIGFSSIRPHSISPSYPRSLYCTLFQTSISGPKIQLFERFALMWFSVFVSDLMEDLKSKCPKNWWISNFCPKIVQNWIF